MVSIEELKSIPAVKQIDDNNVKNFCALPEANQISININTLNINDDYLLSFYFQIYLYKRQSIFWIIYQIQVLTI